MLTVPEELAAAAAQLGAIVSSLSAQNSGAAPAITAVAPAAADPVSMQQAAIFSAYGAQYEQIAAQAQAIQEQYANTLAQSSNTYASTEAANASKAASDPSGLTSLYNFLNTGILSQGVTTIPMDEMGNWASAYSDVIGMGGGGLLSAISAPAEAGEDLAGLAGATELAGTTAPAVGPGLAGIGAMPVTAGLGQATLVGKLSVPPSWAGTAATVSGTTPMGLQTADWTVAAPQAGPGTIVPGMPGMASATRGSAGFGTPRYGVKPVVMPKPATV
ncbi:PE/PPE C-terminal domain-containing protein [Mycobacterium sp. SM1]|uniref:PE/PPE C-terminal domain-containing protein n=1 Tax=Mycobacterium sp. SM1 TaxID=2816243 RepID=UPI001BCCB811|nr:PE/PPE C-terminal domain-containing protein [Mycobacterium sp. SM1]MBS4729213.1 PE/PPE C-terminal domain-containing protein [Mycobacterium sp. SM1]